jgi:hypothetical protein
MNSLHFPHPRCSLSLFPFCFPTKRYVKLGLEVLTAVTKKKYYLLGCNALYNEVDLDEC